MLATLAIGASVQQAQLVVAIATSGRALSHGGSTTNYSTGAADDPSPSDEWRKLPAAPISNPSTLDETPLAAASGPPCSMELSQRRRISPFASSLRIAHRPTPHPPNRKDPLALPPPIIRHSPPSASARWPTSYAARISRASEEICVQSSTDPTSLIRRKPHCPSIKCTIIHRRRAVQGGMIRGSAMAELDLNPSNQHDMRMRLSICCSIQKISEGESEEAAGVQELPPLGSSFLRSAARARARPRPGPLRTWVVPMAEKNSSSEERKKGDIVERECFKEDNKQAAAAPAPEAQAQSQARRNRQGPARARPPSPGLLEQGPGPWPSNSPSPSPSPGPAQAEITGHNGTQHLYCAAPVAGAAAAAPIDGPCLPLLLVFGFRPWGDRPESPPPPPHPGAKKIWVLGVLVACEPPWRLTRFCATEQNIGLARAPPPPARRRSSNASLPGAAPSIPNLPHGHRNVARRDELIPLREDDRCAGFSLPGSIPTGGPAVNAKKSLLRLDCSPFKDLNHWTSLVPESTVLSLAFRCAFDFDLRIVEEISDLNWAMHAFMLEPSTLIRGIFELPSVCFSSLDSNHTDSTDLQDMTEFGFIYYKIFSFSRRPYLCSQVAQMYFYMYLRIFECLAGGKEIRVHDADVPLFPEPNYFAPAAFGDLLEPKL
ncbi:LOW QUALITY PROTEIN: hypothetical protein MARPO_0003s0179 [Marchantia polymorpha]|uniref:Uncharacterized protein n=1 Tax=Marchantia polymorpha TaxID=3197 RepID=A0A2R6XT94_MARPO|nr:LOW QUALITY PROTEIN: hypothetical protein MARPO_0003s0179 [Marchantia polymorpha]|eukprot:PTQ49300.1 LOW QUALITY PROTEIN: hypothetical protein MARPO_0003s0179 [Marchantia polymorpha]